LSTDSLSSRSSQYYFNCQCEACTDNWQIYPKLPSTMEPLSGKDDKALSAEQHKLAKNYRKAFDSVLAGTFNTDVLSVLVDYLNFMDQVHRRKMIDVKINDNQKYAGSKKY
jgi:hypothetical protein